MNDITDWAAGMSLPEVVTLARDRCEYRRIVHEIAKAPHGVINTNGDVWRIMNGCICELSTSVDDREVALLG